LGRDASGHVWRCQRFDRILVLADGKVEAAGTHEDLVGQSGRYAELFELQAAG
jgi:ATP-binding cassette subfamily B protein